MTRTDIIRAWKDAEYRDSLSEAQRALLPENPAGLIELSTDVLGVVAGGNGINVRPFISRPVTQVHCPSHRPGGCNPTHRVGCGGTVTKILQF
jgi:mersacidin/lichenicidin family type 2 lantibiotic